MGITNYLENKLLDHVFGRVTYAPPATVYFALSTTTPNEDGTNFTEPTLADGYTRFAASNTIGPAPTGTWSGMIYGQEEPLNYTASVFSHFGPAVRSWGTITHIGVFDASVNGHLLVYAALPTPAPVSQPGTRVTTQIFIGDSGIPDIAPEDIITVRDISGTLTATSTWQALAYVTDITAGEGWWIAVDGNPTGAGTEADPWSISVLETAGYPAEAIGPGDTVYLKTGTYGTGRAWFQRIILTGTALEPITIRPAPGAYVRINGSLWFSYDGNDSPSEHVILTNAAGCEFEICNDRWYASDGTKRRYVTAASGHTIDMQDAGINFQNGRNITVRNLVIHDTVAGVVNKMSTDAGACNIYGCLIYNTGYLTDTVGQGHGLEWQNDITWDTKQADESIIANNIGMGIKFWGQDQKFDCTGLIVLNDDSMIFSTAGDVDEVFFDYCHFIARNALAVDAGPGANGAKANANLRDIDFTNCRFVMQSGDTDDWLLAYGNCSEPAVFTGNTLITDVINYNLFVKFKARTGSAYTWNNNAYYGPDNHPYFAVVAEGEGVTTTSHYDFDNWKTATGFDGTGSSYTVGTPAGPEIFYRANAHEAGRANLLIYNWGLLSAVTVDFTGKGYVDGDTIQLRNAANYFGDVPFEFVYNSANAANSSAVAIPMQATRWSVASPTELPQILPAGIVNTWGPFAVNTFPKIGAFVVRKVSFGTPTTHQEWYVAPAGSPAGNGTAISPWTLRQAVESGGSPANSIKPGDTLYLLGGTYMSGKFNFGVHINGQLNNPIVIRPLPGTKVVVQAGFYLYCNYVRFINSPRAEFELYDPTWTSRNLTVAATESLGFYWPQDLLATQGFGNEIINLTLHDLSHGIYHGYYGKGCLIYGNIVWNCGYMLNGGRQGIGIATPGRFTQFKHVKHNVVGTTFYHGFYGYCNATVGTDATLNFLWEENVMVHNTAIAYNDGGTIDNIAARRNIFKGSSTLRFRSTVDKTNVEITGNYLINTGTADAALQVGPVASNMLVTDNTVICPDSTRVVNFKRYQTGLAQIWDRNTYYGNATPAQFRVEEYGSSTATFYNFVNWKATMGADAAGSYTVGLPSDTIVRVDKNEYERGRANITIINWPGAASVAVDLSTLGIRNGEVVRLRNPLAYYTDTPIEFIYNSTIPAQSTAVPVDMQVTRWTYDRPLAASDPIRAGWTVDGWGQKAGNPFPYFGSFICRVEG